MYKQATVGDCYEEKPSKKLKTKYLKHEYWCARKGTDTKDAAKMYISTVKEYDNKVAVRKAAEKVL